MSATAEARELATVAAHAAADKKAIDVVVLDVSDRLVITDVFVIASAPNERQVGAIVDNIDEKLRAAGHKPVRREGEREGRWVLMDYVDVVVHIQHTDERSFYALERLWKDCPRVEVDGLDRPEESADRDDAGDGHQGGSQQGAASARPTGTSSGAAQSGAVGGPRSQGGWSGRAFPVTDDDPTDDDVDVPPFMRR